MANCDKSWDKSTSLARMQQERAWIEVDLGAIAHNVRQIRRLLLPQTALLAVVKADAYGHGATTIAQTVLAAGASWLGVATIPEGIELREAGITAPILLLGATNTVEQIQEIVRWQLQPTLCTGKQALTYAAAIATLRQPVPLSVHLNLDTGMSRLGTPWTEAVELVQLVQSLPHLAIASVYSHLATADDPDPTVMQQQQQRFMTAIAQMQHQGIQPPLLHLANSAGTLVDPGLHYDLVRVGLALYGLYPAPHLESVIELRPALQVKARISQVKTIPAGTGVSYGHRFVADCERRMAVIAIGYADGVPRNLSNKIQVLVRGQRVPQIGSITMDQIMLDISTVPDVQEGEVVTLLGYDGTETISADDWATLLGTISWEILCDFKNRLPRIAVSQDAVCREQTAGFS
jgi:alanine racemase